MSPATTKIDYTSPINYTGVYSQAMALLESGFDYHITREELKK